MNMVPEGRFRAKAVAGQVKRYKTGTLYVSVQFEVLDTEDGPSKVWYNGPLSSKNPEYVESTRQKTLEALFNAGFTGGDLKEDALLEFDGATECQIVVIHEEYNQRVTSKVKYINAIKENNDKFPTALEKDELDSLNTAIRNFRATKGYTDAAKKGDGWGKDDELAF